MFSAKTLRVVIAVALVAHGIAHANAIGALLGQALGGPSESVVTIQFWLFSAMSPALVALPLWVVSTLGFLGAAASFWGIYADGMDWRRLAVIAAIVSTAGLALTGGIWPGTQNDLRLLIHPVAAMAMNIAVLVTQLWLHWPPKAMFGK